MTTTPTTTVASGRERLFWQLHWGGWAGYFALSYITALAHGKPADYWPVSLTTAACGFGVTLVLRYLLRPLMRLPAPGFFAAALVPAFIAAGVMGLGYVTSLVEWCDKPDCQPDSLLGYIAYMGTFSYVVMLWVGLYFGIKSWLSLQRESQATLAANAMAHQAQLKMLRYQLNPHFLFNTLNAISTLVLERDTHAANRMVTGLSAFLRHSLDADPMQRVTLRQELAAINLYLEIEKVRFSDRLRVEVAVAGDAMDALLPSLLLQPLVENAIKYAVSRNVDAGTLRIAARRDGDSIEIGVADDGPGFGALGADGMPGGRGVGLRNTRERLRVLYGDRQAFLVRNLSPRGAEILLRLPFEVEAPVAERVAPASLGTARA